MQAMMPFPLGGLRALPPRLKPSGWVLHEKLAQLATWQLAERQLLHGALRQPQEQFVLERESVRQYE
jgi:hypothetical protein